MDLDAAEPEEDAPGLALSFWLFSQAVSSLAEHLSLTRDQVLFFFFPAILG